MRKWYDFLLNHCLCILTTCFIVSCGYVQPEVWEPHGVIHPMGGIRVLRIDGERVFSFAGDYILRVRPGERNLLLGVGANENTPVEGQKSFFAKMVVEIEEGQCYYFEPQYIYGLNNLFFGAGFKEIKAWKAVLKKQTPIQGYEKKTSVGTDGMTTPAETENIIEPEIPIKPPSDKV